MNNLGMGRKRKPHSKETRLKISLSLMGKTKGIKKPPQTQEHRNNISIGHKGIPSGMLGKHHSEETKRKISEAKTINPTKYWLGKKRPDMAIIFSKANLGKKVSLETRKKMSEAQRGEKSPCWIKDRTKLKTDRRHAYDCKYKVWMKSVKNRDDWKCKINNPDCKGLLEAHHILSWKDYPELRYDINNGITLCHAHHPRMRAEEKRLIPTFQELVSVSKVY